MNELIDRLAALHSDAEPVPPATVAADLRRGRRARSRRRTVRGVGVGALALVTAGVTTAALTSGSARPDSTPHGLRLVSYTGSQLPGFTVEKVPAGFVLQGATAYSLDIARAGDTSSLDDFSEKIVVSVEAVAPADASARVRVERTKDGGIRVHCPDGSTTSAWRPGERDVRDPKALCGVVTPRASGPTPASDPIDVDGSAGRISTNSEGAKYFREVVGDRRVVIQVWPTLQLSDAQLRELADGLTVTADAQVSRG